MRCSYCPTTYRTLQVHAVASLSIGKSELHRHACTCRLALAMQDTKWCGKMPAPGVS